MEAKSIIFDKLEGFIKKFYTNELIKGVILFIGFGLLYFIFTLLIEYFLWLSTSGRTILFWLFVGVELFLLIRFIAFPLFKLFKLQQGINYEQASEIIGNHFSEVQDKLLNFLQLANQSQTSELLAASIEQKAASLQPIPFSNAVNFAKNKKFLPYAIIPILLLILFFVTGNSEIISNSFARVVNYETKYAPPALFEFVVLNKSLTAQQNSDFVLQVKTQGKVMPDNIAIQIGDEEYFLQTTKPGVFEYTFSKLSKDVTFLLLANGLNSNEYQINVVDVPTIANFEMVLQYPSYLGKKSEVIQGTGNAVVPEGTVVNWRINALATDKVSFKSNNQVSVFINNENNFSLSRRITDNLSYEVITSNRNINEFEKLSYQIATIKDQYPTISVQIAPDSLKLKSKMMIGQVADDHGLSKLQVVFYPKGNPNAVRKANLAINKQAVDQFIYSFPNGLSIDEGVNYEYYFEVFDNDVVNNYKSTKSSVFLHYELTEVQKEDKQLQEQNENINSLEKSLQNQEKQISELDKLQKMNKEKSTLDFKDQKKVEDFINRQKQQDEMMKEFTKKLTENLEEFNPKSQDKDKEELLRRLEEAEKQAEKNEKLLKELEELSKKLEKDQLFDKADKLKQNAKNQQQNLEQLVELTKRFYVEKKAEQIADKLDKLAVKEDKLADDAKENSMENQDTINKEFEEIQKELQDLEKENKELKAPMDIPNDKNEQEDVKKDMEKASEELQKQNQQKAKPKQKSAAAKMKQMSQKMSQSMQSGDMEQMQEDAKLLRQILDNLLAFSFDEEGLIKTTNATQTRSLQLNKVLKKQQDLKLQFKHVDDSLFAVALRNPKITETILNEVGEIHYNLDKTLETLADNNIQKGASHQQYVLTSANRLADYLSNVQTEMNMEMQGQGSGKGKPKPGGGKGMQLPDIIKQQEGLGEKMKEGMKQGDKPGDKPGEKSGQGKQKGQSGENDEEGENGSEGNAGKVLEILKEQRQLRDALQIALEKEGLTGQGLNALNQMKDIEKQLINKGFKNETLQKMLNLKHELLKLEKAIQQQGEDTKRQSKTNDKNYNGSTTPLSKELKDYLNSVEILNRQSLPLQPNFNQKVQNYFKGND
ncbi:DUF4175 domain-containing protein [Flavobacterium cucumis]|uniref:Glutamyl-tRNA synthetase n=1 Tax=Flavobacterium cucumis TaxID=416016 RepID=A0A1M7ZUD4_9FLAO|nr:DUF4175 family protein [Flavobacterium cucumis]SHO72466.1 hypothetical protein SAMN05443547_0799 [Flavobacterium cucumis]